MKKITKVFILILMIFGISSCSLFGGGDPYSETQEITELKEKGQYIDITYAEMLEKCSNNETFVVYVKSLYCSQCYYYLDEIAKVLKEDPSRNIYCVTFEYLEPEELEALKVLVYKVLGEDYYKANDWEEGSVYIPLTFQVVNGKISNATCGFQAAKYLRYVYIMNFFDLDYFSNVVDKFNNDDNFTLYMSTVSGDEENSYLEGLYEEYKNNPAKTQGYYFNLYKLDNEEKSSFLQLINSRTPDSMEISLETLPDKFEVVVENKVITSINVIE